jgi:hypothetical protein
MCDVSGSSIESRIDVKELANLWLAKRHRDRTEYVLKQLSVLLEQKMNAIAEHLFDEWTYVMLDAYFVHRVHVGREIALPRHSTLVVNPPGCTFQQIVKRFIEFLRTVLRPAILRFTTPTERTGFNMKPSERRLEIIICMSIIAFEARNRKSPWETKDE